MLAGVRRSFLANVRTLTLEEALFAAGGYRSILGVLKHMGGWVHVYRSYAFDEQSAHWDAISSPRGLRDQVEASSEYVHEVIEWADRGLMAWDQALAQVGDGDLARSHPLHWGETAPLGDIVAMVTREVMYHTGEINMLLSIARGEAWEYTEEVEENHISTYGHGVGPEWMTDDEARVHEERLRAAVEGR